MDDRASFRWGNERRDAARLGARCLQIGDPVGCGHTCVIFSSNTLPWAPIVMTDNPPLKPEGHGQSGKLKLRGNRFRRVEAFHVVVTPVLESR